MESKLSSIEQGKLIAKLRTDLNLSQSELGELIGMLQPSVSRLEKGDILETRKKYQLAQALKTTVEYLDTGDSRYQPQHMAKSFGAIKDISANYKPMAEEVHIYHLSAHASMGNGISAHLEHDEVIGLITASKRWAANHLKNVTNLSNVYIITGQGDSMAPTFDDGAPLFVDVGINEIKHDGIYVFEYENELYIKRLTRQMGTIMVLSDNTKYHAFEMGKDKLQNTRIIGRVIGTCPFIEI